PFFLNDRSTTDIYCGQYSFSLPSGFLIPRQDKTTPLFAMLLRVAQRLSDTPAGQNTPLVRSSATAEEDTSDIQSPQNIAYGFVCLKK
ncbi:hypothetical protein, partial [Klebsiella quasipneumoniae]|uniref:hypothetical protein n=1 Tax=Klebsiella quasipneumoniae TaxID=1463165 RepID=UPI002117D4C6